jgi:hypothetical protein
MLNPLTVDYVASHKDDLLLWQNLVYDATQDAIQSTLDALGGRLPNPKLKLVTACLMVETLHAQTLDAQAQALDHIKQALDLLEQTKTQANIEHAQANVKQALDHIKGGQVTLQSDLDDMIKRGQAVASGSKGALDA